MGEEEIVLKQEKDKVCLSLEGVISSICSWNIRTPIYTFLMANFLFYAKNWEKNEKKPAFFDQSHTAPSNSTLSLPKIMGWVFYHTSLSDFVLTWIIQNFVFNAYANQKLWRKTFERGRFDPTPSWYQKG